MLTASASKGKGGLYYYYHCIAACGVRFKAENANSLFVRELKKYVPKSGMNEIQIVTIKEAYHEQTNLSHLDVYWEKGTVAERRNIASSIFPEKLTFDGFTYRTPKVNEAARLIFNLDAGFKEMKNGKSSEFSHLSRWVVPTDIIKNQWNPHLACMLI